MLRAGEQRWLGGREGRQAEDVRRRSGSTHDELHDGTGIGTITSDRGRRTAAVGLVRIVGEVIEAGILSRHRRRIVVIEDELLAGEGGEVHNDVGTFSRANHQAVVQHAQNSDGTLVVVIADWRAGDDGRRGQKTTLGADLDDWRTGNARIRNATDAAI